jgi:hypothetical protein
VRPEVIAETRSTSTAFADVLQVAVPARLNVAACLLQQRSINTQVLIAPPARSLQAYNATRVARFTIAIIAMS